jgi:hypothetical protein
MVRRSGVPADAIRKLVRQESPAPRELHEATRNN